MVQIETVQYGSKPITDPKIKETIRLAITQKATFRATPETLGSNGEGKCVIQWRESARGPLIQDSVDNGQTFDFAVYIKSIEWGFEILEDKPEVYDRLHQVIREKKQIQITSENLGGDPMPDEEKLVEIEMSVRDWPHPQFDGKFRGKEGEMWPRGESLQAKLERRQAEETRRLEQQTPEEREEARQKKIREDMYGKDGDLNGADQARPAYRERDVYQSDPEDW